MSIAEELTTPVRQTGRPGPAPQLWLHLPPLDVPGARDAAGARLPDPTLPSLAAPDMPAAIGWTLLAAYGWILLVFWITFAGHADAAFMVAISTAYCIVFAAVPWSFLRIEQRARPAPRRSWSDFTGHGLDTFTGVLDGKAAMAQILSVPIALAITTTGIGVAILTARAAAYAAP